MEIGKVVSIEPSLHRKLKQVAAGSGTTVKALVECAVESYLDLIYEGVVGSVGVEPTDKPNL